MRVVENKYLPPKGFFAINLFGTIFVRKGNRARVEPIDINHEKIHTAQMKELGYLLFYVFYLIEWLIRLSMRGNAYRSISFEREAYAHQSDYTYLCHRKHYSWLKYLWSKYG